MDHQFNAGNWSTIPNIPTFNNNPTPLNQDQLFLHQQQLQLQQHLLNQQHQHQQSQPNFQLQQQQQHVHHQQQPPPPPPPQLPQQQQHQHQSLASHFHLLPLVESLAHTVETGTRDQQSESLVNELSNQFDKCQQLLNSIAVSIGTKVMTVEGQRHKLEETEQILSHRKDLIAMYRSSIEELTKSES